jgi:hypothetical protein
LEEDLLEFWNGCAQAESDSDHSVAGIGHQLEKLVELSFWHLSKWS